MQPTTITILGAGYVGLTTAALMAEAGHTVYALEPNIERLDALKQGKSFFFEEGLDAVIQSALSSGRLIPTDSYEVAVPKSNIVFSCVGTPDNPDGSSNLSYVYSAAEQAASHMKNGTIFVQKSTVPVGTGAEISSRFSAAHKNFPYVSNPEFLREGTALNDTLFFDRIVAGGDDVAAVECILDLYRSLEAKRNAIAELAGISIKEAPGEYIATDLASAELIKVTANAFLALKISFANSIAKLADKAGADVVKVMDAVGADKRIGRAFLNAGRGYGGGCFPKDVSGLISSGLEHGVNLEIVRATKVVNDSMPGYAAEKLQEALEGSLKDRRVAILGLAFKAGTSDARRSPGVAIANLLARAGANVTAFDPKANSEAFHDLVPEVHLTEELNECIASAEALVFATDWPELVSVSASDYKTQTGAYIILDAVNALPKGDFTAAGFTYLGIGR